MLCLACFAQHSALSVLQSSVDHSSTYVQIWPKFAAWFGVPAGEPLSVPLGQLMTDKEPLWKQIQEKHGLDKIDLDQLVQWPFAEASWKKEMNGYENTTKLQQAGFHGMCLDTAADIIHIFEQMAELKVIPGYGKEGVNPRTCLLSSSKAIQK